MKVNPRVVWEDWTLFRIVCSHCHRSLVTAQWSSDAGQDWSREQKIEQRTLSRLRRQDAARCDCCDRTLVRGPLYLCLISTGELLGRYEAGERQFKYLALVGANLDQRFLAEVQLMEANLNGTHFVQANLESAVLSGASCLGSDFTGAALARADFSGAELIGANFQGADLRDSKLIGADLRGAELYWSNLSGANLRGALLDERSLRGSILSGAIFPDGWRHP